MLTIAVCDDQQFFADKLEQELKHLCIMHMAKDFAHEILPPFSSAKHILEFLAHKNIDILFLDIEMPGLDGFALAKQLREQYPDMLLIFVSAYEELVFQSFAYHPFWFLRKSHIEKELPNIFTKAIAQYMSNTGAELFATKNGNILLPLKEILYLEAEHNYYTIYCTTGAFYKCRGTLSAMASKLEKHGFYRVHSAYLVNMAHIWQISSVSSVVMKNNKLIPVSRHRAAAFKNAYSTFVRRRITR